ncbi:MAG: CPBP family intramembrane metalloprotease [Anaerolineae bacterium]|nr:CPBP family intramembrane metalloprotease [Anaerolineae bacterium]
MSQNTISLSRLPGRSWIGLTLVAAGVALFFIVNQLVVPALNLRLIDNEELNQILLYQFTMLGLTLLILMVLAMIFKKTFWHYVRFGDMQANPEPVGWLGIRSTDTWLKVGITFTLIVSIGTSIFMVMGMEGDLSRLNFSYLGLALLFALSNSFIEEAITRLGVVVSLDGILHPKHIAIISGLVFGIPHFFGIPGGPIGAIMAGFMGWLLAKSMLETRGVFWAWFIHFLQDVIIFMVMVSLLFAQAA